MATHEVNISILARRLNETLLTVEIREDIDLLSCLDSINRKAMVELLNCANCGSYNDPVNNDSYNVQNTYD